MIGRAEFRDMETGEDMADFNERNTASIWREPSISTVLRADGRASRRRVIPVTVRLSAWTV